MNNSKLFDLRAKQYEAAFRLGVPFQQYIQTGSPADNARWSRSLEAIQLQPAQSALLAGFTRKMQLLCLSGIWCGDCARQCPIIHKLASQSELIELRFVENVGVPELADELRIHGAARVPVLVCLSEDFFEVARFGDRPLATYRQKAGLESGPACAIGGGSAGDSNLNLEIQEWLDVLERAQLILKLSPMLRARYGD